jgi:hypothetical protein
MSGKDNLRPARDTETAKARGKLGGIASGKAKREKKFMSQIWAGYINQKYGTNGKSFKDAADKIWAKGGGDLIRFWKEMREATEGSNIKVEVENFEEQAEKLRAIIESRTRQD